MGHRLKRPGNYEMQAVYKETEHQYGSDLWELCTVI